MTLSKRDLTSRRRGHRARRAAMSALALSLVVPALALVAPIRAVGAGSSGPNPVAWGADSDGQIGSPPGNGSGYGPVVVAGVTGVVAVAAGRSHSLALTSDGSVLAWGADASGQLGDGSTTGRFTPEPVTGLTGVTAIAAGGDHSLALRSDGTVWAWGDDTDGELGDGRSATFSSVPVEAVGLAGATVVSAGDHSSIALGADRAVWTWGGVDCGGSTVPTRIPAVADATAIGAGGRHDLIVRSDGTVWGWGLNAYGELGDGTTTSSCVPVQAVGVSNVIAVAGGEYHSMALESDGTVLAWGFNADDELGSSSSSTCLTAPCTASPTIVGGLPPMSGIAAGSWHSLALARDGSPWSWGKNDVRQLGTGSTSSSSAPAHVELGPGVHGIAGGGSHTLAVPSLPSAPQAVASTACNSQITVHWQAPTSQGSLPVTGYRVYRGTVPNATALLATTGNVTSYRDGSVVDGTTYTYQVTAFSDGGEGAASAHTTAQAVADLGSCPLVQAVSPDAADPGSTVTVTGQNFDASTTVSFGATPAAPPTVDASGTFLTVVVPSPSALPADGVVDVTAANASGPSRMSPDDGFSYMPPQVQSMSPAGGPLGVRTQVTVHGLGFVPGSTVRAGNVGLAASDVTVENATTLVALLPASNTPSQVGIFVDNPLGPGSSGATFTYGPPSVSGLYPQKGTTAGGQRVSLALANFADQGVSVSFGGRPAIILGYDSFSKVLIVATPSYVATHPTAVPVTVTTVGGVSNSVTYTYWPPPTVTHVAPAAAPSGCTTWVAITGTNFDPNVTTIYFGTPRADGSNAAPVTLMPSQTPNTILALTPCDASMMGLVNVIAVSTGGQSQPGTGNLFLLL